MVFTIDIGNSNIVLGAYRADSLCFTARMTTSTAKTEDEYAVSLKNILELYNVSPSDFEGAAISSVVPSLNNVMYNAVKKLYRCRVIVVSPGIRTGLNIMLDNPAILGADLVCGAVGALKKYKPPCVIFDMGTATTASAVDKDGNFLGGSIFPGVRLSLKALSSGTAQLPDISLNDYNGIVIGTNTFDSMCSGIILGTAGMLDGILRRYKSILGEETTAIATGGLAESIVPYCENVIIHDPDLILEGLFHIYKMNTKPKK